MSDTKQQDNAIKSQVKETIKNMTLDELMIAIEEQNNGLINNLKDIVLSQIDVIKTQQEEMLKMRDLVENLTNTITKVNAQTQMIVQKQKDLEEFALIASGVKKINETTVGIDKLKEEAEKYVELQERAEQIEKAKKSDSIK